jgi:hypothetical protein
VNITLNGCFGRTAPHPTFTLSTSPVYSNKEVKMFSGLVRTKVVAAHAKIATIVSAILPTSLFVSIPSTSTNKNSAKATVTGLKPGQKVKVTVNVRPKP